MANAITGTPVLSASPTNYAGANSQLSPAIQTIWSKEILFQSMPILRYEQFAVKKTELGVQPGLTINFMRYNNLGAASQLVEGVSVLHHRCRARVRRGRLRVAAERLLRRRHGLVLSSARPQHGPVPR